MIRDEGGCPDKQLSLWADSIIFVFSLEKEDSLEVVNDYYQQMSSFRSMGDVPLLLVGTQGIFKIKSKIISYLFKLIPITIINLI